MIMSSVPFDGSPKDSTRAERFAIQIPVRYHKPHSSRWFEGRTENISHSGVLFRAEFPLDLETTVEMRVELPAILGEAPGEIVCKGPIVRIVESPVSGIPPALAVAIRSYRMARKGQVH
jgi:hypothetical protein